MLELRGRGWWLVVCGWYEVVSRASHGCQTTNRQPPTRSGSLDARLLDFVQQGLVTHTEQLRSFPAVPVHLAKRVCNDGPLSRQRSFARNLRQPTSILSGRRRRYKIIGLIVIGGIDCRR